jgi:iron complex outermembrane receptor protein
MSNRFLARGVFALGVLALVTSASASATAQVAIQGTVTAARDGGPLADVSVFVAGTRRGTITDAQGRYRIAGVPAGPFRVVAMRVGYSPDTINVAATAAPTADFKLEEAAAIVSPVVISATRELQRRNEGSVTVDAVSGEDIRNTRASHPADIMNRVPGVHVSQLSGEGHSMAMRLSINTSPMYLYLEDGIPTRATGFFNHNALYEVNIPQAGGIEVIKGPGTALHGSDAIGGIVNVLTRPAPLTRTVDIGLEGGGFGYRRMLATAGNTWGNHGVRADLNVTHSDNWKQDAPFDRVSGTIRWDAALGNAWSSKTILTGSRIDQQDVPAVSKGVYDTAMTTNLAPIAFRRVRALRLSNALEKQAGASLVSFTSYARVNQMGLLPSWQLSYDPQVWDTRNNSVGFLARWRRDVGTFDGQIIIGVDGDWSPGSFTADKVVPVRTGPYRTYSSYTTTDQHYDYDVTYRALSPYVQTRWSPVERLHIDAGLRTDMAGYAYMTKLAPLDTGSHRRPANTTVSYSHVSPKVGAAYEWSRELNVFASYRDGFRAPSQGQLFQQNSAVNSTSLKPVNVVSYEAGIRGQLAQRLVYQVSAYDMTISNDILNYVTPQNTREATNAGESRHQGVEASAGVALLTGLRLDLAYSNSTHEYVDWTPQAARPGVAAVSYSGNQVEQAPRDLGAAILTWSPRQLKNGRIVFELSHVGRYVEDPANTPDAVYEGHDLVHVNANYFLRNGTEVFARLQNAANRRFAELVSYDAFQRDQYTPGQPRTFVAGLRHAF